MFALCRPGDADQHHAVVAFGIGEQRVAMVDRAVEHPRPAGAAKALLAGVGRTDTGAAECREQGLVGADPHDRPGGGVDTENSLPSMTGGAAKRSMRRLVETERREHQLNELHRESRLGALEEDNESLQALLLVMMTFLATRR